MKARVDRNGFVPRNIVFLTSAALASGLGMMADANAACTTGGPFIVCTGPANPLAPNFASSANAVTVTVNPGASLGVLAGEPNQTALELLGNNVTLNNYGAIDSSLLGGILASGTVVGNSSASSVIVNNFGVMNGTSDTQGANLGSLAGLALAAQNGTGGVMGITNTGLLESTPLDSATVAVGDMATAAVYGGGRVNFTNGASGIIIGRVAFQAPGTPGAGNTFTNAGTITGSVSLGAGATNTFTAQTGSSVEAGVGTSGNTLGVIGFSLSFAQAGVVDGGASGDNTLHLEQAGGGPAAGSIAVGNYINFNHLSIDSGSWTLTGASTALDAILGSGATATINDADGLGTGNITSTGGAISAAAILDLGNTVSLGTGGLTVTGSNALTMSGLVQGSGALTKSGAGALTLAGANLYTGGTNLNGGTLVVGNASALGTSALHVGGNSTFSASGSISIANAVDIAGGATLTLLDNTNQGFNGQISGAGALVKQGAGTSTLGAANSYTGGTTINSGMLELGAGSSLAATGSMTLAGPGAVFDISASGANQTIGALSGVAGTTVSLGAHTLTFGDTTNQSYAGTISGSGGVVKTGTGVESLTGANSYGGGTAVQGGGLIIGNNSALGTGVLSVNGAASLDVINPTSLSNAIALNANLTVSGSNALTLSGSISGLGGMTKNGAATLTLAGANSFTGPVTVNAGTLELSGAGTLSSSDDVNLANAGANLDVSAATTAPVIGALDGVAGTSVILGANTLTLGSIADGTFGGTIGGTGGIVKNGSGTETLTGANTYTGDTTINAGTLALGAGGSLAAGGNVLLFGSGAVFDITNAGANQTVGALSGVAGSTIALGANSLSFGDSMDRIVASSISGSGGLVKNGAGVVTLSGASNYSGGTTVNAGGLVVGSNSALGSGTLTVGGAAVLDSSVATTLANNVVLNANLTVLGSNNLTLNGSLSGTGGLTKDGAATLTLNGTNTYTGGTQINAGTLALGANASLSASGIVNVANGATFDLSAGSGTQTFGTLTGGGTINLGANVLTIGDATDGTFSGSIGGNGSVVKEGTGTETLTGTNTYSGATTINAGTLALGAGGSLSATTDVNLVNAGAGFDISGATGATSIGSLSGSAGTTVTLGANTLTLGTGQDATYAGAISGGGGLVKTGASTQTLTGANTYAGGTTLNGGTLSVSSDSNLGLSGAAIDFEGGTLQVTGTSYQQTNRNIAWGAGGGFDIADAGNTFTVSQPLNGAGALVKLGAGTLVLTGSNTYTGGTTVNGGTLQGDSNSLQGDIADNARVVFVQASDGTYGGQVSGSGSLVKDGAGVLVLTGPNNYRGGTSVIAGTLQGDSASLHGDIANNATVVFKQTTNGAYTGALTGNGVLDKDGAGVLTLSGNGGAYTGNTQLREGGLQVDGSLGGSLAVQSGTVLSGTGSVGSTTIASGATLAPGNAVSPKGTLTVNGNLSLASGSTFQVHTDAVGGTSSVHATGAASVAGTVLDVGQNGTYSLSTRYGILSADGGVSGTFGTVTSNLAFLAPSLEYGANKVDLVMALKDVPPSGGDGNSPGGGTAPSRPIQFADLALTGNQRAVANALQSLPASSNLYTRVLNLPEGTPAGVFASLSGEAYASTVSSLQGVGERVSTLPMSHLQANLDAGQLAGPATAQLGRGDGTALPQSAAQPVWAQVFGNWRTQSATGDTARTSESDGGLFVGGDQAVGGGWRLGGALGYTDSHTSVKGLSSTSDIDSYSATIYGGKAIAAGPGKINLSLGAAYTWHDVKTKRNADAAGVEQTLKSTYGASTGQIFGEVGYALPLNDRVTLEPFVGAGYSDLRTRGFSESGGDAALDGKSQRDQLASTTLGLHAQTMFESGGAPGRLRATLGWRHAYGDVNPETTMAFQGSQTFTVTGAPIARNAAVMELGVDMAVSKRTTVGVAYGGQFGSGSKQNAGSLDVRYRF
jgi:outer membrane autotransporter protein